MEVGKIFYSSIFKKLEPVSSTGTAEFTKLLENIYRAVNIGLVNEMKIIADLMKLDIYEIIKAASTKPFGFKAFYPGPGTGGHCIPIDPHYLSWKLKTLDYDARFIQLAGEINTNMPNHILNLISTHLNNHQKSLNGSKILILGVAYKKDINDTRESPALDIIQLLINAGAKIDYHDPYVPKLVYNQISINNIAKLENNKLNSYDACVVVTDHSNIDYAMIYKHSQLIIDTRNVFKGKNSEHVKRLGQG